MNFQSIEYIITTSQERSISKAAAKLHISQQTLSAHIASVEEELGCQLFIRHIPLELTYAGEEFIRNALPIQAQFKNLQRTFDEISGNEKGILKIGITDNRDKIILLPIILAFQQDHPCIEIKVVESANEILIQKLIKGEIDVCISDFSIHHPSIKQIDLYQERVVFVIQKKQFYNLFGEDSETVLHDIQENSNYTHFQKCPLLLGHEQDICGKFTRRLLSSFEIQPPIKVEAENIALILGLCANGLGGCFCPEIIARNTLSQEQLEEVLIVTLGKGSEYEIRIGWKDNWNIIQLFTETAKETLKSGVKF